jgi:hypothetical protein
VEYAIRLLFNASAGSAIVVEKRNDDNKPDELAVVEGYCIDA